MEFLDVVTPATTNIRGARVIQVVQVVSCEGKGTPEDPSREVVFYYGLDGKILALHDPTARTSDTGESESSDGQ